MRSQHARTLSSSNWRRSNRHRASPHPTARLFVEAGGDGLAHVLNDLDPDPGFVACLTRPGRFVIPTLWITAVVSGPDATRPTSCWITLAWALPEPDATHPALDPPPKAATQPTPTPESPGDRRLDLDGALRSTRLLHQAGMPILAGTDVSDLLPFGGHGVALHLELALLVKAGLTPSQALAAATWVPAPCFGLTDCGRIAPGHRGDLLLVDGDPTSNITATRDIAGIWHCGVRLDRDAYRVRLPAAAAPAGPA